MTQLITNKKASNLNNKMSLVREGASDGASVHLKSQRVWLEAVCLQGLIQSVLRNR